MLKKRKPKSIMISIDESILKKIDSDCKFLNVSRSAYIEHYMSHVETIKTLLRDAIIKENATLKAVRQDLKDLYEILGYNLINDDEHSN